MQCPNDAPCVQCKEVEQFKEERRKKGKPWTIDRVQEACCKVALEDIERLSIAAGHFEKEDGLLETDHRSSRRRWASSACHSPADVLALAVNKTASSITSVFSVPSQTLTYSRKKGAAVNFSFVRRVNTQTSRSLLSTVCF